jgi:diguanylate cyclase (GGDEF)-like protein
LRSSDVIGRYGGDELMILLSVDSHRDLDKISNKLRVLVQNSNYKHIQPSVTIGATLFVEGDTVKSITKRADEALLEAKNVRRNQVNIK